MFAKSPKRLHTYIACERIKSVSGRETEAAIITLRHAKVHGAWRKSRLLAVKLLMQGTITPAQVSGCAGIARGATLSK